MQRAPPRIHQLGLGNTIRKRLERMALHQDLTPCQGHSPRRKNQPCRTIEETASLPWTVYACHKAVRQEQHQAQPLQDTQAARRQADRIFQISTDAQRQGCGDGSHEKQET
ncbi:hypothetical protein D3C80_1952070 [compost metagenome]